MGHFIRVVFFLTAFNFLACNIPGIMPPLSRLSGLLVLTAWVCMYLPFSLARSGKCILALSAIPVSFALVLREPTFLLGISLCLWALIILSKTKSMSRAGELPVYLLMIVSYTLYLTLYRYSPYCWFFLQKTALTYSSAVTALVDNEMTLGPTAAGIPITVSMLCYSLGLIYYKRKVGFALAALCTPLLANAAFLCLQQPLADLVSLFDKTLKTSPLNLQAILMLVSAATFYPLIRKMEFNGVRSGVLREERLKAAAAVILVFVSIFVLSFYRNGTKHNGEIIFCDKGTNWAVPNFSKKYGQKSAGMFGMLPYYLEMRGYKTKVIKEPLTVQILSKASAVVVFNPSKYFTGMEKKNLFRFIENGGALLVAGDHTDVSGVMGPVNDILTPFNITLNFDTALPITSGWIHGLEKRPHPVTAVLNKDQGAGIWVGASLAVSPPARPVITGKLGWADIGDYSNKKRAFLGNYKRSSNEQLGDVVLVAESEYGEGRVLVFGDTSTFQNGILMNTYFFIDDIFSWLVSARGSLYDPFRQTLLCLALLAPAVFLLIRMPSTVMLMAFVLSAHAALWVSQSTGSMK
ncbi:MAG: hypothetical protein QGG48_06045, partial [Desulfatiglandales bacterium]|nr:hypothetical protein [Desulfatiglandales bacterium]